MEGLEVTVLLGVVILVGTVLAPRLRLATPLVLLVLGLLLGFVPAFRAVQLPPETVLLLFLPVMLFWESFTTSLRSIRRDLRYIAPMSTLLVVASAFAVAWIAKLMGVPWEAALILGAAVAPTDATAVAALGRLLPQRQFMKLKAESLTNDGTALAVYAIAVSLAVGGHVTAWTVTWTVLDAFVGGAAIGVAVAAAAYFTLRSIRAALPANIALLLTPFVAFLLAELIGASGVLAVVVAGLITSWVAPRITTAASRRQAQAVWPFGVYLLNGALFVLIGLEVQYVLRAIAPAEIGWLLLVTVATWAALVVVRYLFQLLSAPFSRSTLSRSARERGRIVSTFAGFRGAVSLAIALAVPLTTGAGSAVLARDEVVFVTAGVIVLSLLVQGPLLPAIVRWARPPADDAADEEYVIAKRAISSAAMASLDDLAAEHGISDDVRDRTRREGYEMLELANAFVMARQQASRDPDVDELENLLDPPSVDGAGQVASSRATGLQSAGGSGGLEMLAASTDVDLMQRSPIVRHEEYTRLKLAVLERQREVLLRLRREDTVDDLVVWRLQARLDLEEIRLRGLESLE
jgi:Na+/H+ antiporter